MTAPTKQPVAVVFECELRQIKTMADGTVNVTLNLPEYCIPHAKVMMDWLGGALKVVAEYQGKDEADNDDKPPADWGGKPSDWK